MYFLSKELIRKKSLLLLDEPFNSLDPGLRKNLYSDVVSMTKKTPHQLTLISSHLIEELKKITNSFIFLHNGRVITRTTHAMQVGRVMTRIEDPFSDSRRVITRI